MDAAAAADLTLTAPRRPPHLLGVVDPGSVYPDGRLLLVRVPSGLCRIDVLARGARRHRQLVQVDPGAIVRLDPIRLDAAPP